MNARATRQLALFTGWCNPCPSFSVVLLPTKETRALCSWQRRKRSRCYTLAAAGIAHTKKPIRTDGLDMFKGDPKASFEGNYLNEKLTSMFRATSTGTPFFIPGRNFHCFSAWMAFSSNPSPRPRTTFKISMVPSLRTMADSTTTP